MSAPELRDSHESWPVLSTTPVYSDEWIVTVRRDSLTLPEGGEPFERLIIGHPGAAIVLAIDDDDRVLCVKQYRHAAQLRMVELPAGVLDQAGEEPLDVAKRELREETGHSAEQWTHLISVYASPGVSEEVFHCYLARGLHEIGHGDFVHAHEEAEMEVLWVPFDELLGAVLSGRVADGALVAAVLAHDALHRRERAR